jgi:hypothetical protein
VKLDVDYLESWGFSQYMHVSIHGQIYFYFWYITSSRSYTVQQTLKNALGISHTHK